MPLLPRYLLGIFWGPAALQQKFWGATSFGFWKELNVAAAIGYAVTLQETSVASWVTFVPASNVTTE